MSTQRYTVTPHPIETLLTWVKSREIAIPEIQRPFVWDALAQTEINIAIGDKAPTVYFKELAEQCNGGKKKYGGITDFGELKANLVDSCIPDSLLSETLPNYDSFLEQRRKLMAGKIKAYFQTL